MDSIFPPSVKLNGTTFIELPYSPYVGNSIKVNGGPLKLMASIDLFTADNLMPEHLIHFSDPDSTRPELQTHR